MKKLAKMITTVVISALTLTMEVGAAPRRDMIETPNVYREIAGVAVKEQFPNLKVPISSIKYVLCNGASGTAFVIAPNTYMTAYHVLAVGGCQIDGNPIMPIAVEREKDFVIVAAPTHHLRPFKINCNGFTKGSRYYSIGFPGRTMTLRKLIATEFRIHDAEPGHFEQMYVLNGQILHGTSGGPVLNEDGEVVGMNSAEAMGNTIGLSRMMGDTHYCDAFHNALALK